MKQIRVLVRSDFFSKKIYEIVEYFGDGEGDSCYVDSPLILDEAEAEGYDLYYEDGKLIKKEKDPTEYFNKLKFLRDKNSELKKEERKVFAEYSLGGYESTAGTRLSEINLELSNLRSEMIDLRERRTQQYRSYVKEQLNSADFKYYCSICLIIKNENEYLEEWLLWHIDQGVEHFYIYDHDSQEPVEQFIKGLDVSVQEKITLTRFSGNHDFAQHDAYNDCLNRYRKESRWIGFIDADEMVRILEKKTLPQFLKEFEDHAGVFIGWNMFGANGQKEKRSGLLRERFGTPLIGNKNQTGIGKVFIQPFCMRQMLTHNGFPLEGFEVVDEKHESVKRGEAWKNELPRERACVDHYYTKSYEEWVSKIKRGTCDPYFKRKYKEFFEINPDMEYCREDNLPSQGYEISYK